MRSIHDRAPDMTRSLNDYAASCYKRSDAPYVALLRCGCILSTGEAMYWCPDLNQHVTNDELASEATS